MQLSEGMIVYIKRGVSTSILFDGHDAGCRTEPVPWCLLCLFSLSQTRHHQSKWIVLLLSPEQLFQKQWLKKNKMLYVTKIWNIRIFVLSEAWPTFFSSVLYQALVTDGLWFCFCFIFTLPPSYVTPSYTRHRLHPSWAPSWFMTI